MPDPIRHLATLKKAVEGIRSTTGRTGRLIDVAADEVLICGDLHGHLPNFQRLWNRADLARRPRRHLVFQEVIHGVFGYPNGGDKSHQLLDLVAATIVQFPGRVHFLPGNHEFAQLTNRAIGKDAEMDLNEKFRVGVRFAYGVSADAILAAYDELFRAAPLVIRTMNGVVVSHSLPSQSRQEVFNWSVLLNEATPENELAPGGSVHSLVWGRDTSQEAVDGFLTMAQGEWLVTGHIPCDDGYSLPNNRQVILDCHKSPAAAILIPTDRPLTHDELVEAVETF